MMPVRGATVKRIVQNVQKMEVWTRAAAAEAAAARVRRFGAVQYGAQLGRAGGVSGRHPAMVAEGEAG